MKALATSTAEFLIKAIDDFSRYVDKPTVLVLDNAPTHRSELFVGQLEKWMEKDVVRVFLAEIFAALEQGGNLLEKSEV